MRGRYCRRGCQLVSLYQFQRIRRFFVLQRESAVFFEVRASIRLPMEAQRKSPVGDEIMHALIDKGSKDGDMSCDVPRARAMGCSFLVQSVRLLPVTRC